jgi:hypothetical protein
MCRLSSYPQIGGLLSESKRIGEQVGKKLPHGEKSVPQRLKPHCKQSCGTGKPVPLNKAKFFPSALKALVAGRKEMMHTGQQIVR